MNEFATHQHIITVAENEKKTKKGDGINAVLVLMKDLRDFQEKVDSCLDAQDIEDYRQKIASFDEMLDSMYETLLEIASGGISSIRERNRNHDGSARPEIPMMNTNQVQRLP